MSRGECFRALFSGVLAVSLSAGAANAQNNICTNDCRPTQTPTPPFVPPSHRDNSIWYAAAGILIPMIGIGITWQLGPPTSSSTNGTQRTFPPRQPLNAQLGPETGGAGAGGGGGSGGGAGPGAGAPGGAGPQALRAGFNLPPPGAPYVRDEVLAISDASEQEVDRIAAQFNMTRRQSTFLSLINRTVHLLHIDDGGAPPGKIIDLAGSTMTGAQANFLFKLTQAEPVPVNPEQYAPQKLNLTEAHRLARGSRVLIAVIDSAVDAAHPDLGGAIVGNFDAAGNSERPHAHGTAMAGAIGARHNMLGTAPGVGLLTVRAFGGRADGAEGTTYNILKGLDWAAAQGARVINMSFAGPADPRLREALAKAKEKGIVLVAAAGNAGPNSPPLFPAADPNVIAVTATNADDALFAGANRGNYISVAAPGVAIYAPAPEGSYQLTTGTSVAAAEVSGVAALLIERNPSLTPAEVRKILMDTAKDLGPKGRDRDFGAGLVNALKALTAVRPR